MTDHLFSVSQVIEKGTLHNQEAHLMYADVKEAYDSVSQKRLWEN